MKPVAKGCLRIIVNALSAKLGGGPTYIRNLLEFPPEEFPAQIIVLAPDGLAVPAKHGSIQKLTVRKMVGNAFARAAWENMTLPELIRDIDAHVLFCPGGIVGGSVPPGCKTVTMFRNMIPFDPDQREQYPMGYMRMRNLILNRVMRTSMVRADLVICVSDFARRVIEGEVPGLSGKTVVIPHGVSPLFRANNAGRPAWLPAQDYILYASILDYYKAQVEVVRAFAVLKQKRAGREKLVLAGPEKGGYGRSVRTEIERLDLAEDVIITGRIPYEEMPGLYRHARINVFASKCENCPNIVLEALAAGRPLLSSNFAAMRELAGDAAIYFDPSRPEDLAGKLASLLDSSTRERELSRSASARSELYNWQKTAAATWKAIANLANTA